MPLWLKIILSYTLVAIVLWFMWRLPQRDDRYVDWAPMLALISPWAGLISLAGSIVIWLIAQPEYLIGALLWGLEPIAIGTGILVMWIYRRREYAEETVRNQLLQARVGIGLGAVAVGVTYCFMLMHIAP